MPRVLWQRGEIRAAPFAGSEQSCRHPPDPGTPARGDGRVQTGAGRQPRLRRALTANLATLLQDEGNLDEAEVHLREAVRLQPGTSVADGSTAIWPGCCSCSRGSTKRSPAIAQRRRRGSGRSAYALSNLLLISLNYHPRAEPATLLAEHRRWAERFGESCRSGPLAGRFDKPGPRRGTPSRPPAAEWDMCIAMDLYQAHVVANLSSRSWPTMIRGRWSCIAMLESVRSR